MKRLLLTLVAFASFFNVFSQNYIEPFLEFRTNKSIEKTNNPAVILHQIYTGIQLSKIKSHRFEYAFQLGFGLPISHKRADSSFTLNTNLPVYMKANKTISVFSTSIYYVQKYLLVDVKEKDKLNFLINTGFTYRNLKITYDYDKTNYTILNPDKTQSLLGVSVGMGFQYTHIIKNNRLFIQAYMDFPLIRPKTNYPGVLKTIVPLTTAIGYSLKQKK